MFASALDEARVLIMRQEYGAAIPKLTNFLNGDFWHSEALFMLGGCFSAQGMNGLSAVVTSAAIQAREAQNGRPFPEALTNLGCNYRNAFKNDMAEKFWLEALKHEKLPKAQSGILSNMAALFLYEGQPDRAIEYADKAIALDPANTKALANRGIACLEKGEWAEGWKGWRYTNMTGDRPKVVYGNLPEWDGTPGQTVIVHGDQGIGDEIFFASALPDMQRVCKKVILDCHPRLPELFQRSFPDIEVHGTRKDLTELDWFEGCGADATIALSDLFGFFRLKEGDWPGASYLNADPYERAVARQLTAASGGSDPMRIGISWTGGTSLTRQHLRSIPIDRLEPILRARPDAQWFSLQYTEDAARQICEMEERTGIRIAHFPTWVESIGYGPSYRYDRTASLVASLDLVISVPTTVHHLAGALGVPNWLMVQSKPDWRCQLKGSTLPWYKSTKVYRQEADGDWFGPIAWVAQDLEAFDPLNAKAA